MNTLPRPTELEPVRARTLRSTVRDCRARRIVAALALVVLVAACGGPTAQVRSTDTAPPESGSGQDATLLDFEPVVIRGGDEEQDAFAGATDMPSVFREASDYFAAGDYQNALRLYELLLAHWDDQDYRRVTFYNSGLALENLDRWDEAAARYRSVIEGWPASEDALFAHFRLAECFSQLGEYELIPPLMKKVLPSPMLTLMSRVEGNLRIGRAFLDMRRFADAEKWFRAALAENESAARTWNPEGGRIAERPLPPGDVRIAESHYGRGQVYHELFLQIRFVLPAERITRALVDKTQLFEQARMAYLDAVRTAHPYWAPAAGFMLGQMYEDYYFDVLATEVPRDFNELELEVYFEELRRFIQPALERALAIYSNSLAMAYRLRADNEWIPETINAIDRVRNYLESREGWDAEQRLIVEQRHSRSARFADDMVFRTDSRRSAGN